MGRIDLDAHSEPAGTGVDGRGNGSEGLAEHDVSAAVEEADDLLVALHRHGRDRPFGRQLKKLESHLLGELASARRDEALHEFWVQIVGNDRHRLLPGLLWGVGGRG